MTTARQDKEFIETVINDRLLELAIEWIAKNMIPQEVFSDADLREWAEENGYVEEPQ